jgi:hypothetical protein
MEKIAIEGICTEPSGAGPRPEEIILAGTYSHLFVAYFDADLAGQDVALCAFLRRVERVLRRPYPFVERRENIRLVRERAFHDVVSPVR